MIEATQTGTPLRDVIRAGRTVDNHRPWPRAIVGDETWRQATRLLSGGQWVLLGLWGERGQVHMAVNDNGELGVLRLICGHDRFPSGRQSHPPAPRLAIALRDLWGLETQGASA